MDNLVQALLQNSGFKAVKGNLPTIDFVYPAYTADGLSEAFRFSHTLLNELAEGKGRVVSTVAEKTVVWTAEESLLLQVDPIAPRLRLKEQISGKVNSIYSYAPMLFVGVNDADFVAYVVKPIIDARMAWFELTPEETIGVRSILEKCAEANPYRSPLQRFGDFFARSFQSLAKQ